MPIQLEKKLVEEYVISELEKIGWKYVESEKLNRMSFDQPLLIEDLKKKVFEINKNMELTDEDLKMVVNRLESVFIDQNGHKDILRYFKNGVPIKTEKERILRQIQIFDYENIERNDFVVTNQFEFYGREKIIPDILLFVNGIPLVNIECKNPYRAKTDYFSAYKQIKKRYENLAPELYKYIQIGVGFAEKVKYFPIVPWLEEVKQEIWKWEGYSEEEGIFYMLRPEVLLDLIKNFIFVREFKGEMTKVIARYMQYRTGNKIYQRVIDNLAGKTEKNKGLIWHWQGSGKTLTMIFSAYKLYCALGKPTVFFIVDRRDLERQFNDELSSLDLGISFEKIESIKALKEILTYDDFRGKRGIFLTLIHKFSLDEEFLLNEILGKAEIQKRKDIICFLDEVHRDQYGKIAGKMKSVLKNAFFFGFTGTPISFKDRNTYKEFGFIDEDELYLDKYFIDEAEKDGFVMPMVYERRKEKEIGLPEKDLEWFFEQIDVEDISDELELKGISKEVNRRLNEIVVFLENPKFIDLICRDIAEHFKENFDEKFKGLIVTGSRKACVRFKRNLDKYLNSEYSEVVMTFGTEDEREIETYKAELTKRFNQLDTLEIIKEIIEKFRKEEYPKLLIVTDMLITGFDEPKLGVLYLFKILKHHRALQTIARVNRPYIGKPCGLIVDYAGIFKFIKLAFEKYFKEEKEIIKKFKEGIISKEEAFEKFVAIFERLKGIFGNSFGVFEKESFDKVLEILKNDEVGNKFISLYSELRAWYEILRGDERMIYYLKDYKWLTASYEKYLKIIRPDIDESKINKYFERTLKLIYELVEIKGIRELKKPVTIDLDYIKKLRSADLTEEEKTIGALTGLSHICVLQSSNPIYKNIAQKVKELVEKWKNNEIDLLVLSQAVEAILNYIEEKEEEKKRFQLPEVIFGIKICLENKIKEKESEKISKEIFEQFRNLVYSDWVRNPAVSKMIEKEIREYLVKVRSKFKLSYEDFDLLHKEIFEFVKSHYETGAK